MKAIHLIILLAGFLFRETLPAQVISPPKNQMRKPVPYPYVREADVMWSKFVWRVIDLREKMNQPLYYPLTPLADRKSLFDVICGGLFAVEGKVPELTGYSALADDFTVKLSNKELKQIFYRPDTVMVADSIHPDELVSKPITVPLTAADIVQYWLKEEWFFDKQRSVMEVRIIGVMPIITKKNEKGDVVGLAGTCWLYFPEMRNLLVNNKVFNRHNSAQMLSFDDVFMKRQFSSYIIKEDNVYDRMIADYKGPNTLDALLEAEAIKDKISEVEMDLWQH